MSTHDSPVPAYGLVELPFVFKYLDRRYGTPDMVEPKKKNGEYVFRLIIKYLSYHKRSTCEEIAQYEYDNNLSSQRKLKSITDDIRKFLKNNLIETQIVYHDEPKKKYNKQIETYSLSPIGIFYSMYLLGNFRVTNEFGLRGYGITEIDGNLIKSLGKEYSETLPKVFGKFEFFEKIFGKYFIDFIITPFIAIYELQRAEIPTKEFLLTDHVLTSYQFHYTEDFFSMMDVHKYIAEQISLIFYIHLEESLVHTLRDKMDEASNSRIKNGTAKYRESLKQAREKWIQIMDEDKELKKWYNTFLKNATKAKKDEYGTVNDYRKEVYSHWDFPSQKISLGTTFFR